MPCALGLVFASPILVGWWWVDATKRRREQRHEAELALTLGEPNHFVLHELSLTLPTESARMLASEMDLGMTLAHRTAEALASVSRGASVQHSSVSYADAPTLRAALEERTQNAPQRGYRGARASHDPGGEGPDHEVVWVLGAAYVDPPAQKPESSDLSQWLDTLVPAVPERTLVSAVSVRTPVPSVRS
jgi:hypothetical protein